MIRSAFSLLLPLIVAGEGKGPQGISLQRKLAAVLGEGRIVCLGSLKCVLGGGGWGGNV